MGRGAAATALTARQLNYETSTTSLHKTLVISRSVLGETERYADTLPYIRDRSALNAPGSPTDVGYRIYPAVCGHSEHLIGLDGTQGSSV